MLKDDKKTNRRIKRKEKYTNGYEAIVAANNEFPSSQDWRVLLKDRNITTAQEARDFVFFNLLRNITDKLDPSLESLFLTTIQGNILSSTFKFK